MAHIIAGHFLLQEEIAAARAALLDAGFHTGGISDFYVNQPGQHDQHALGGDRDMSPGAKETPEGVATGAATGGVVGAAIGAATAPFTGPAGPVVGALVGAHVGSLYSLNKMKPAGAAEDGPNAGENRELPRPAGMLIAVAVDGDAQQRTVLELFSRLPVQGVEQAEGTIADGDWRDFDPLSTPRWIR